MNYVGRETCIREKCIRDKDVDPYKVFPRIPLKEFWISQGGQGWETLSYFLKSFKLSLFNVFRCSFGSFLDSLGFSFFFLSFFLPIFLLIFISLFIPMLFCSISLNNFYLMSFVVLLFLYLLVSFFHFFFLNLFPSFFLSLFPYCSIFFYYYTIFLQCLSLSLCFFSFFCLLFTFFVHSFFRSSFFFMLATVCSGSFVSYHIFLYYKSCVGITTTELSTNSIILGVPPPSCILIQPVLQHPVPCKLMRFNRVKSTNRL